MVGGEYESADQLEDFSTFFTAESKSSLKRNLTEEIWNEYKDQVDDAGVTFKTMCFSGIKNQDSGIGLYAGSHGSYTKFNKLFDKVIQEYHGHSPTDTHTSDMNAE
jgi:creatine kinase/arginine kinase